MEGKRITTDSVLEGGCLCGDIRYRATAAPFWVGHCHCRMCQKHTGAAFATDAMFRIDHLFWPQSEPTYYRSSETTERGFCPRCGSTVSGRYVKKPDVLIMAVGTLDNPDLVEPTLHEWTSSRAKWLHLDDGLREFPEGETESG